MMGEKYGLKKYITKILTMEVKGVVHEFLSSKVHGLYDF
jgi:hypothetical protein